jgi:Flp pilus assembly protein TadB
MTVHLIVVCRSGAPLRRRFPVLQSPEDVSETSEEQGGVAVFANIRWEVVSVLMFSCVVSVVLGLVLWMWVVWIIGLLGLLVIVGDIAWTIMSFARAKRAGESKLKF